MRLQQLISMWMVSFFTLEAVAEVLKRGYNIRKSPGGRVVANSSNYSFLYTGKAKGKWYEVSYMDGNQLRTAWVHRSGRAKTKNPTGSMKTTVRNNYNVRSQPNLSASSKIGLTQDREYTPALNGRGEPIRQGKFVKLNYKDGNGNTKSAWVHRAGTVQAPFHKRQVDNRAPANVVTQDVQDPVPVRNVSPIQSPPPAQRPSVGLPGRHPMTQEQRRATQDETPTNEQDMIASEPHEPVDEEDICSFRGDPVMEKNCKKLVERANNGDLPKEATMYSLKTFKQTFGKYCDGDQIHHKVRNHCSFFFTNLDKRSGNTSPAYFVDLCAGDKSRTNLNDLVNKTRTRRGTGGNFTDISMRKTTLAGVFRTGNLTAFHPKSSSTKRKYRNSVGYKQNDRRCKGKGDWGNEFLKACPVVRLSLTRIGGARTDHAKPMHTTPFGSSWGCPSIPQENNWMMRKMAQGGVSLYIAYTKNRSQKKHFEAPASKCGGAGRNPGKAPDGSMAPIVADYSEPTAGEPFYPGHQ